MAIKSQPDGYHTVTAYLVIDGAAKAIDYYREALGAQEIMRMPMGNKVGHAEIRIGDSVVMLSDEWPDMGLLGPGHRGGTTVSLMIYVPDVDAVFQRATDAGGRVERPIKNEFYGDRSGTMVDPFGHRWMIATHIEDVSPEEMNRRMEEMAKVGG